MRTAFDPEQGLVIVKAKLWGPAGTIKLRLALDTGATITTVNGGILIAMGYDPNATTDRVRLTTGSGIESAPRILVNKATFLGQQRLNFAVIAHTLPPTAGVDGLLGLDCFRNRRLVLDFLNGHIRLT